MDVVEYFRTVERMCNASESCSGCPLTGYICDFENQEETVAPVEKWAKEHPIITNADKLVEAFGQIKPSDITPEWLRQEYKAPEGKDEA